MKRKLFKQIIKLNLVFLLLMIPGLSSAQQAFVTTWNTNNTLPGGSTSSQIRIPIDIAPGYNYNLNWVKVDNPSINGSLLNQTGSALIDNLTPGVYRVEITGSFPRIAMNSGTGTERLKLLTIEQWGTIAWTSMLNAFSGCANLTYNATDSPNLTNVTDMGSMFGGCSLFVGNDTMNNWNTSTITNMSSLFIRCPKFNSNIGSWNTSNVTNMGEMFFNNDVFNQDLSAWNTSNVTNMRTMFFGAKAFNQNLNSWNTSSVTNMIDMFNEATAFNGNISSWNTSSVNNMAGLFASASAFNQNISGWNTANVVNMTNLFANATVFNQNISTWNTTKVVSMYGMFNVALSFNQNLNSWDTGNVTNMQYMFKNASAFNGNIGNWNTIKVTNMQDMFWGASVFNQNLNNWNTSNVTNMKTMFYDARAFNGNISNWNTVKVTNMNGMFFNNFIFNQDISNWNTQLVTNMSFMFTSANAFNQNIGNWNVTSVTNMTNMLTNAFAFNQNLGSWTFNQNVVFTDMLSSTAIDCSNFSATLIGWSNNALTPNNKNLGSVSRNGGGSRVIGNNALSSINNLVATKGWTLTGQDYSTNNCVLSALSFENDKGLTVYPNPSKGIFNIETKESLNVSVYDLLGKKVKDIEVTETKNQIDLTNLKLGVYLVSTINQEGQSKVAKVIIE
jgi:surface protein